MLNATVVVVATASPGTTIGSVTIPAVSATSLVALFTRVGFNNGNAAVVTCNVQVSVNNTGLVTNPTVKTLVFPQTLGATGTGGATTSPIDMSLVINGTSSVGFTGLDLTKQTTISLLGYGSVASAVQMSLGSIEIDAVLQSTV